jgi:hypothetical protein
MAASDVQELYRNARLHQSMQQVALISYIEEGVLLSPLFNKIPQLIQKFLNRKLSGLEGRDTNVRYVEIDSYNNNNNKKLPSHLNKALKDICIR